MGGGGELRLVKRGGRIKNNNMQRGLGGEKEEEGIPVP